MKVGYIVNGTHPLLETISASSISTIKDKKILIVGMDEAISIDPTIPLYDISYSQPIGYCFSHLEGEEQFRLALNGFITTCIDSILKDYTFHFVNEISSINYSKEVFVYENSIGIYIVNTNKETYYLNKQFMSYFGKSIDLNIPNNTIVWRWEDTFSALLQCNRIHQDANQLENLLTPFCEIEKEFAAYCMEWRKTLELSSSFDLWKRAYKVENYLSGLKIKMDIPLLEEESETNSILKAVLDSSENGYVVQHYKGTDKTTGRIFPKGDGFSLQTFPHELRHLVIAEEESYLVEFDYQHFEYSLLSQMIGLKIEGDPHLELAKLLFKDETKRPLAKTINYGLLYGRSLNVLITELINEYKVGYSREELEEMLKPISEPVDELNKKLQKQFDEKGFIINHFGREVVPTKRFACLNNYISSTATDYMIIKIEKLTDYLNKVGGLNKIILQNHDSILINLSIKDIENTDIASDILNILESEEKSLITKVDLEYGRNWALSS